MDLKQLTLRQCIKSTWNILVSYYVLNCYKYWLTLLDKLKTVVNGNVLNYSGEVEMIFLLTQYFIHRVAKSSLGVDITPIKNGTCMSWKKLKNDQKQTFVFCSRHFFFVMRNVFKSLLISRQLIWYFCNLTAKRAMVFLIIIMTLYSYCTKRTTDANFIRKMISISKHIQLVDECLNLFFCVSKSFCFL